MAIEAIDSHAHVHFKNFDSDRDLVIHRAKKAGVIGIINIFISHEDYVQSIGKIEKYINQGYIKVAIGFAPQLIDNLDVHEYLEFLRKIGQEYIAIGECGLDYYWITDDVLIKKMEGSFQAILEIVRKVKKPLIIHARTAHRKNAYLKIVEYLNQYGVRRAVFHSFLGSLGDLKKIMDGGWYVGIPTVYVRRRDLRVILENLDLNKVLVETDSPYLSPRKGERNEPANVIEVISYISAIRNEDVETLSQRFLSNTARFFNLEVSKLTIGMKL